jgi:hypothetical protein
MNNAIPKTPVAESPPAPQEPLITITAQRSRLNIWAILEWDFPEQLSEPGFVSLARLLHRYLVKGDVASIAIRGPKTGVIWVVNRRSRALKDSIYRIATEPGNTGTEGVNVDADDYNDLKNFASERDSENDISELLRDRAINGG